MQHQRPGSVPDTVGRNPSALFSRTFSFEKVILPSDCRFGRSDGSYRPVVRFGNVTRRLGVVPAGRYNPAST
jgi:hypothetical protein